MPHTGEIRLEGRVLAVDAARGTLTLGVTSFALPNGNARRLGTPRPKTVLVSDLTLLQARGETARRVELDQLRDEVFAVAIGADTGSGQALPARRIAVWNRVVAGGFRFEAPEEERNELADGGFENAARGAPAGWTFGRTARWERDEAGNHFALIAVEKEVPEAERKIKTLLDADPSWKTLRVSARLRLRNSRPGQEQNAHLGVVYYGANSQYLGLGPALTLTRDSEWATLSGRGEVPAGTQTLLLDVGVYGPAGELSVDDVRVVANPRLARGPLRPGLPEGTFEVVDAHGLPRGWSVADSRGVQVLEEGGNHFLRLTSDDPMGLREVEAYFPLPPGAHQLVLRYRARARGLKPGGSEPFQNARVGYLFTDAGGQRVGDWPATPGLREDVDWTWLELQAPVPPSAALLKISPMLLNVSGTLDVDDIRIEVH